MGTESIFQRPGRIIRFEADTHEFGVCDGEIARVFSPSGQLLREYRNFCDMEIPEEDRLIISGQILTCTHPLDTPFSRKDLVFAAQFHLAEIRVIGKSCVYSLKPKGRDWPDPTAIAKKYDEIRSNKEFVVMIAAIKYSPEFLAKSKDPEMDIFRIRRDLICQRLAKVFGLEYRKAAFAGCYNCS